MKICIISPHLDDAILSCGVFIQRRRAAGDEVLALNIFTAGTLSDTRKKEDFAAMAAIGAVPHFLDELDAPDRDPKYKPVKELFFGALDPRDPIIGKVEKRVGDFLSAKGVDLAVFPLAAGTHIDHRIAFEAGKRLKSPQVRFYEDRPYIIWPGILQSRMKEIGADAAIPDVSRQQMEEAAGRYFYLDHFMPVADGHRKKTLPMYLSALERASAKTVKAAPETLTATQEELHRLYASLACYGSQMKHIYRDEANFIADSLAYERETSGADGYIERMWALSF